MRFSKNTNSLTYGMILKEFKDKNPKIKIIDYRPCCELFGFPSIKNAIIIWMKSGTKIVYKSQEEE